MYFKNYIIQENIKSQVASIAYIMSQDNLNEEVLDEGLKDFLGKIGLQAHKGKGIIDYLGMFTKLAGKMILAAIKDDKETVKKLAQEITKEQVLDFLLKLDQATLHLITGPIHFIDAVTGWHIGPALGHAAEKAGDILAQIWKAIKEIKDKIVLVFDQDKQKKLIKQLNYLENAIPQA